MRKPLIFICIIVLVLLLPGFSACSSTKDKVEFWITQTNPDDPHLTSITSEQSNNVTFWARGTTDEKINCEVRILEGNTMYFDSNIITEGSSQAYAVGRVLNPLPGGDYVIAAVSNTTREPVGSLKFTVIGPKDLYPQPPTSK
jgi:hypothetical protein